MIAWYMGLPSVSGLRRGTSAGAQTCSRFARELSPGNADLRSDLAYRPSVRCGDDLDRRSRRGGVDAGTASRELDRCPFCTGGAAASSAAAYDMECAYSDTG